MKEPRSILVKNRLEQHDQMREKYFEYDDVALLVEEFVCTEVAIAAIKQGIAFSSSFNLNPMQVQGVVLHVNNVDRVKQMAPVLGWFAKRGLMLKGKPEDYPEIKRRTWYLGDKVAVMAFFRDGGVGCRYVKVGEEMKAIYELQCDDGMKPEGSD